MYYMFYIHAKDYYLMLILQLLINNTNKIIFITIIQYSCRDYSFYAGTKDVASENKKNEKCKLKPGFPLEQEIIP